MEHMMAMVYLLAEGNFGSEPSGNRARGRAERRATMARATLTNMMVGAQIRKRTRMGAPQHCYRAASGILPKRSAGVNVLDLHRGMAYSRSAAGVDS